MTDINESTRLVRGARERAAQLRDGLWRRGDEHLDAKRLEVLGAALEGVLGEAERLRSTLLRVHGYVQGAVRREVPTFEDEYGAEYDASLIESLAEMLDKDEESTVNIALGGRGYVDYWLREKARERRKGVS